MEVIFLGQGFLGEFNDPLGERIKRAFCDNRFHSMRGFIAFASAKAATFLIELAQTNPAIAVKLFIGIDLKGTSKEALEQLLANDINTCIFYTVSQQIFHPKVYLFEGDQHNCLIVGSSNLTGPGFYSNVESNISISFATEDESGQKILQQVLNFFSPLYSGGNAQTLTKPLIEYLASEGLLPLEAERSQLHEPKKKEASPSAKKKLQGMFPPCATSYMPNPHSKNSPKPEKSKPAVPLPAQTTSKYPKTANRFWLEAGSLTGGSRNQLDLSRVSKHGHIADGSLSLFGLSGTATSQITQIKIRYKGIDYDGSRILFPKTPAGKTNDTWRLQMNGTDFGKRKLTKQCQSDFVGKILIFKELGPHYYQIKPFSPKRQLKRLINISKQWDCNKGGRGKHFGIL